MKKIISVLLTLLLLAGFFAAPVKAYAAEGPRAGIVNTASGNLNVRSSATTTSSVKTSLPKGSLVTVVSENGSFFYVRYSRYSYGYCHKSYIKTVSEKSATVNTQSTALNVRAGDSTAYKIIGSLSKGEAVAVLSQQNGWAKILYHGNKTGYVSSAYLKFREPQLNSISLAVPSYKQTDTRWANVYIGNSGKTIAKIGCATTSIAMLESYRRGISIYPDAMSKKLSYSSSGNVYWPTDYKVHTSSADYLKSIYDILSSGKPVLFGAKNRYGSQHWIVITGFTGDKLTPSAFTINDPGSSLRKDLQQFLNSYPVFYKYFSY